MTLNARGYYEFKNCLSRQGNNSIKKPMDRSPWALQWRTLQGESFKIFSYDVANYYENY